MNGSSISYRQEIQLHINLAGQHYGVKAYYSPVLPYSIVLGYDFLKAAKMTINFGKLSVQPQQTYILRASKDIFIDPLSEMIIWAKMTGRLKPGLAVLSVHKSALSIGIGVARALVTIDCNKPWVTIRILNPDNTKKHLPQGTRIASAERLNLADQITEPEDLSLTVNNTTASRKVRFQPPKEFSDLFDLRKSTFNSEQANELLCLLWDYSDVFLKKGDKLGCTDLLEFEIKLKKDARPF